MRCDLDVLDFDSIDCRLESTKKYHNELLSILPTLSQNPIKSVLEIDFTLYGIFEIFSTIGRRIIIERMPLTKKEIEELSHADKKLFEVRQKASDAGERGKGYLYTINQLSRLHERFLAIGKIQKKDFGRMSGVVSLFAFVIQVLLVHFTIHPTEDIVLPIILGEIIIALIAGYGYEAIRFKPLLGLYSDAIKSKIDKAQQ